MAIEVAEKKETLENIADKIISQLRQQFPKAEFLLNGETYGDADLYLDIYIDEPDLIELDRLANEVTFRFFEETGYDILPMVAPMESYPIKQ